MANDLVRAFSNPPVDSEPQQSLETRPRFTLSLRNYVRMQLAASFCPLPEEITTHLAHDLVEWTRGRLSVLAAGTIPTPPITDRSRADLRQEQ